MGSLISPQKEISRLRFVAFGSQAKVVEKVVKIDMLIMAKVNEHTVATNRVKTGYAYLPTDTLNDVVKGLRALGMITREAMDAHIALTNERAATVARKWSAKHIREDAAKLGITLTARQLAVIEAAGVPDA
jgi:hypothetical protein